MEKIGKVLVIGSGPIQIGQAAEFDYSGSQACLSLREEGVKVVLVNNNPATIQTDSNIADIIYLEPLNLEALTEIIRQEKPDALLPTMGGQTGLNLATELHKKGALKKYHVRVIGTPIESIIKAESREEFAKLMKKIGEPIPKSRSVSNLGDGIAALDEIGLPAIIRPGFTLGGTGGGVAHNNNEFREILARALKKSANKEALVEEYVGGWKEIEYEVMRDSADNCIMVCNMENFDPMGVHTGDSIVAAPSQTLTDFEYQTLRSASINIIRALGIDGGCNVQFALHPNSSEYRVIEVNPRVSRSSALASKATGYPIARVAAKIALGRTLDEIPNAITKFTVAAFEPALDYVVVKMPRWPFDKFGALPRTIGTEMKSTGEVMAIGRTFEEALQKAVRSLDIGRDGLNKKKDKKVSPELLKEPTDNRLFNIYYALKCGASVEDVSRATNIDPFFIHKIKNLVDIERELSAGKLTKDLIKRARSMGFSDGQISTFSGLTINGINKLCGSTIVFKMVDTCAGETEAKTPYFYSTHDSESEVQQPSTKKKKVIIIGAGPIRIGQGVEFDYCTVHAVLTLRKLGYEAIIINNNPETVSTDFDISDKLYFEPLTLENVLKIVENEKESLFGVIVQFGGQTSINLAGGLKAAGVHILGTSADAINLAEDRREFGGLCKGLDVLIPRWGSARNAEEARRVANNIDYPVLVRPSYVLGGRAMVVVYNDTELNQYIKSAAKLSGKHPVLIDKFLEDAIEVDVDAISDSKAVYIAGVMEHIEEAGIHSGDSSCTIPPQTLSKETIGKIEEYTRKIAIALETRGMINIQFAVKNGDVYILEANPRASRTVPFVSKAINVQMVDIATKVAVGQELSKIMPKRSYKTISHVAVKGVKLPFDKLRIDPLLGPEMRSTGEVIGIAKNFGNAFYKSALGVYNIPKKGRVFISVREKEKGLSVDIGQRLEKLGYEIIATTGTHMRLRERGVRSERVLKVSEGSPNAVDAIQEDKIDLVINTPATGARAYDDGLKIRTAAVEAGIPYVTTITGARALVSALESVKEGGLEYKSWNSYFVK